MWNGGVHNFASFHFVILHQYVLPGLGCIFAGTEHLNFVLTAGPFVSGMLLIRAVLAAFKE